MGQEIKTKLGFKGGKFSISVNGGELVSIDAIQLARLGTSLTETKLDDAALSAVEGALKSASFEKEI